MINFLNNPRLTILMPRKLGRKLEQIVELDGVKYLYTPYEVARRGYVSIYDMNWLYGLTRAGFYSIYNKMKKKPKKIKIGKNMFYHKKTLDDYFFKKK